MTIWKNEKGREVRTGHGEDELRASPVEQLVSKHLDLLQAKILELFQEHRKTEAPYKTEVPMSAYKLQELMTEASKQIKVAC